MRVFLLSCILSLCTGVLGCSQPPYMICRGEDHCSAPMTQEEVIQAAQVKKAWSDEALYVRPVKPRL
jgi:hypothetical protein